MEDKKLILPSIEKQKEFHRWFVKLLDETAILEILKTCQETSEILEEIRTQEKRIEDLKNER